MNIEAVKIICILNFLIELGGNFVMCSICSSAYVHVI